MSSTSMPKPTTGGLDAFPRNWTAQILPGPPMISPARQFVLPQNVPGEEEAMLRGALFVQVTPSKGPGFLAACARGFGDRLLPSGLWACPSPDDLLVVSGGYAYQVPIARPESTELLEQRPVTAVVPAPDHQLLLLVGFHDVLALGAEGILWRSARLSWEGVTPHAVHGGELRGSGWDMFSDREVPFTIDLRSGAHEGGGYNPFRH